MCFTTRSSATAAPADSSPAHTGAARASARRSGRNTTGGIPCYQYFVENSDELDVTELNRLSPSDKARAVLLAWRNLTPTQQQDIERLAKEEELSGKAPSAQILTAVSQIAAESNDAVPADADTGGVAANLPADAGGGLVIEADGIEEDAAVDDVDDVENPNVLMDVEEEEAAAAADDDEEDELVGLKAAVAVAKTAWEAALKAAKDYAEKFKEGWLWQAQAPQMPHANVLDLLVFPMMSRRHCEMVRRTNGLKVASADEVWRVAEKVWDDMPNELVARAFVQYWRILGKVIKAKGGNDFVGSGGTIHCGVGGDFDSNDDGTGIVRRDGKRVDPM